MDDFDDDYRSLPDRIRGLWLDGIDERSYALFRIVFASVALANLVNLWFYRETLFSSGGMISADAIAQVGWQSKLSVFAIVESSWGVVIVFAMAAVAMVCLGLGISARLAAVVVFVWHLSFINRILPVSTGWDHVLEVYSFLVMVSPLGLCWSWRKISAAALVPMYGITLMRVQLLVIYWQGVTVKLGDKFWQDGEFMTYFLMSVHARWPHERVVGWNDWLIPVTYVVLLIEIAIPLLLLIPRTRKIGFWLGFGFHLLILVFARHIFMFSLTMWMTYAAFATTGLLDRVEGRLRRFR